LSFFSRGLLVQFGERGEEVVAHLQCFIVVVLQAFGLHHFALDLLLVQVLLGQLLHVRSIFIYTQLDLIKQLIVPLRYFELTCCSLFPTPQFLLFQLRHSFVSIVGKFHQQLLLLSLLEFHHC